MPYFTHNEIPSIFDSIMLQIAAISAHDVPSAFLMTVMPEQVYSETLEGCSATPVTTFAQALDVLRKNKATAALKIHVNNLNRSVCTILSNEIAKVLLSNIAYFS